MSAPRQPADVEQVWGGWDRDQRLAAFEVFCGRRDGSAAKMAGRDCDWDLEALLAGSNEPACLETPLRLTELLRTDERHLTTAWADTVGTVGRDDCRAAFNSVMVRLSVDGAPKRSVKALEQLVVRGDTVASIADVSAGLAQIRQGAQNEFVGFLGNMGLSTRAEVELAAAQRKHYREQTAAVLAPHVEQLRGLTPHAREGAAHMIGQGSAGMAFAIDVCGTRCALKLMHDRLEPSEWEDHPVRMNLAAEVHALRMCLGVRGAQQLVVYSIEDRILVSELGLGQPVYQYGIPDQPPYEPCHLFGLIDTMIELWSRGLYCDPSPANLIYHPQTGFLALEPQEGGDPEHPFETVLRVSRALTWAYRQSTEAQRIQFGGDEAAFTRLKRACARVDEQLSEAVWAHHPKLAQAYIDYVTATGDRYMSGAISAGSVIPDVMAKLATARQHIL